MGTTLVSGDERALHPQVRRITVTQPFRWLWLGWHDLRRNWRASLGYGALITALGWSILVVCATDPYLIAAAITGFLLVGPLMSAGFCEMSRRYALGQPASFDDSLEGFGRNASALFEFGVILAIAAVLWFIVSGVMLAKVFGVAVPGIRETMYQGFLQTAHRPQLLAYLGVGAVLAAVVFALSVVAVPLIVDRHASARDGIRASVRAVLRNLPAMVVWSALIASLTILGYAPLLLGLVLTVPLLGHATWHAYKAMIG